MQVRYYMTARPLTVDPDEAVEEARDRMAMIEARHLPVVRDGEVVGIVSDRDLRGRDGDLVQDVMSTDPVTVAPTDELPDAGRLLLGHRISALPVVEDGVLVGVLTTTNCLTAMIQLHHELRLAQA